MPIGGEVTWTLNLVLKEANWLHPVMEFRYIRVVLFLASKDLSSVSTRAVDSVVPSSQARC